MKKTQAFTLIELLVVIVIIAILAGMAMPVFTNALERGRSTEDKSNLSQLGKGVIQYLNDMDGTMFPASPTVASDAWPILLQAKYIKDWGAFRSPFDKVTAARPKSTTSPCPISYGINKAMLDTVEGKWVRTGSAQILAAPAIDTTSLGTLAFASSTTSSGAAIGGLAAVSTNVVTIESGKPATSDALGTHKRRRSINVLFADGHVEDWEWSKFRNLPPPADGYVTKQWNPMAP